jgi:regulator of sirC expression with transglutaminase-like and TPR domain
MGERDFASLAPTPEPPLDEMALALAREFREVDWDGALTDLDALGEELEPFAGARPEEEALACGAVLGSLEGFAGNREQYDHPDNSMLDLVLERRTGLPIALSVVYVAAAQRAGIPLAGIGLPGHFVVGHFGAMPPLLLDPFGGGKLVETTAPADLVRPWTAHETALRMLNNLVASFSGRGEFRGAIKAAALRLELPVPDVERRRLEVELHALEARLN